VWWVHSGIADGGGFAGGYGNGLHGGYGNMLFSGATANGIGATFPSMNGYPHSSLNELAAGSPNAVAHSLPVSQMGGVKNFGSFSGHSPGSGYGGLSPGGHIESMTVLNPGVKVDSGDIDSHGLPLASSHPVYAGTTFSGGPNRDWSN